MQLLARRLDPRTPVFCENKLANIAVLILTLIVKENYILACSGFWLTLDQSSEITVLFAAFRCDEITVLPMT